MNESTTKAETKTARPLGERMEATTAAVAAAHDAHLRSAIAGVRWERRGLLGRLTRP